MADFVGDDIGLGELARLAVAAGAELGLHIVEERGVEINARVARAVERPHRRLRHAAAARLRAGIEAQLRRMIGPIVGGEDFTPGIFGAAEDQRDEAAGSVLWRARLRRRRLSGLLRAPAAGKNLRAVEQHARIDTEIPADQADDDDSSDAEPSGAARHAAARCTGLPIILDVIAWTEIIGAHEPFSF